MSLNAKLVVVGGEVKTEEIKLKLPSTIGRGRGTSIMLAHPLVSRQHCELFEADGQLMVRDLGSLNGTFINNERITEAPLPPGELLTVGTVTFRAVYGSAKAAGKKGEAAAQKPKAASQKQPATVNKASAPTPKPPSRPRDEDQEVLEFDFDKPLMSFADDAENDDSQKVTERLASTLEETQAKAPAKKPAPAPTGAAKPREASPEAVKPAAPAPKAPPAKSAPPANEDSGTLDFESIGGDAKDEQRVESSSDDDLNDFLKSLDK
jgi:pSer/pThr/pTyr-binding forkhead associated (FHA) protein